MHEKNAELVAAVVIERARAKFDLTAADVESNLEGMLAVARKQVRSQAESTRDPAIPSQGISSRAIESNLEQLARGRILELTAKDQQQAVARILFAKKPADAGVSSLAGHR